MIERLASLRTSRRRTDGPSGSPGRRSGAWSSASAASAAPAAHASRGSPSGCAPGSSAARAACRRSAECARARAWCRSPSNIRSRAREYSYQRGQDSRSIGESFHCRNGSSMRAFMRRSCSSCPTSSHSLMSWMPLPTTSFSNGGTDLQEAFVLLLGAEPHHVLDAGAVVPAAIEDHDLARRREVLRRSAGCTSASSRDPRGRAARHPEHARADPLGQRADGAAFAGRVAPFEDDDRAVSRVLHPLLHHAELGL